MLSNHKNMVLLFSTCTSSCQQDWELQNFNQGKAKNVTISFVLTTLFGFVLLQRIQRQHWVVSEMALVSILRFYLIAHHVSGKHFGFSVQNQNSPFYDATVGSMLTYLSEPVPAMLFQLGSCWKVCGGDSQEFGIFTGFQVHYIFFFQLQ